MGILNLRINEIVTFLNDSSPEQLDDLREKYPQYQNFLKLGVLMSGEEDDTTTPEEVKFKLVVAEVLQKTIKLNINKQLGKISQEFLKGIEKRRNIYQTIQLFNWNPQKKRKNLLTRIEGEVAKHHQIIKYLDIDAKAFNSLQEIKEQSHNFSMGKAQDLIKRSNNLALSLNLMKNN